MESSGRQFYERVRAGYTNMARETQRIVMLDGTRPVQEIHDAVWNTLVLRNIIQS